MSLKLNKKEADRLKNLASLAGISLSVSLTILKTVASIYTGSLSILSSMIDSVSDVLGSCITFIAVKFSSHPATYHYRYGYGKAEALSALLQSIFIAFSGLYVLYDSINRLINPQPIEHTTLGLTIMIISLIATIVLILYQKHVVKKTGSQAIKADSAHYVVDILTNSSIIITLIVIKYFGWVWFDTLTAAVISCYLLYNAFNLARDAVRNILDKELDAKVRNKIKHIVLSCPEAKGLHDLRTRDLGGTYIFEFHLELDKNLSLHQAHELAHQVENLLLKEFPDSQISIHQEPAGIQDERLDNKLKKRRKFF